ncbi:hypothetical protein BaRGS_00017852 [Batillaria attramentaria]|uniref:Uncharacterized protein n=1 Tax=Batillaria attramentaria TaxID=370345 RepID=A0ABD0KUZ0_9CAEN
MVWYALPGSHEYAVSYNNASNNYPDPRAAEISRPLCGLDSLEFVTGLVTVVVKFSTDQCRAYRSNPRGRCCTVRGRGWRQVQFRVPGRPAGLNLVTSRPRFRRMWTLVVQLSASASLSRVQAAVRGQADVCAQNSVIKLAGVRTTASIHYGVTQISPSSERGETVRWVAGALLHADCGSSLWNFRTLPIGFLNEPADAAIFRAALELTLASLGGSAFNRVLDVPSSGMAENLVLFCHACV